MHIAHPEWKSTADTLSNFNFQSTVFEDNNETELAFETHLNRMKKADIEFAGVELNAAEIETPKSTRNFKKWLIPVGVVAAGLTLFLHWKIWLVFRKGEIKNNQH